MRLLHNFSLTTIKVVFLTFIILLGCKSSKVSQLKDREMGENPYYLFDGQPIVSIQDIDPQTITAITKIFPKAAAKEYGAKAVDGAYIIESRAYAKSIYESLFSSFSRDYAKIINSTDTSAIQYILNGKVLKGNFEGELSGINEKSLKKLEIVDQSELSSKFQITNKPVGVIVTAKAPTSKSKNKN